MHWGPNGRSGSSGMEPVGMTDEMMEAGYYHGANIARVAAAALKGKDLLAKGNVAPSEEILQMFAQG